jgi:hypothetical protein
MSPLWPASSRRICLAFALAANAALAVCRTSHVWAQEPPPLLLFKAPEPFDALRWRERIARRLGPLASSPESSAAAAAPSLAPERLLPLQRIESLLASAREQAAALAEDEALSSLAEAARIGEQLGDVPGAAAWNAEIDIGLGVTAAQAGLPELAAMAFRTAANLDPARRLLEAEAPPAVVGLYDRIARQVAVAPLGRFEVRVATAGTVVYLDDVVQGSAPARLHASVGRHLLRVEARGHRVYGAFIDVLEGERPAFFVQLSPEPALEGARTLVRAARRGDYDGVVRAERDLQRERAGLGPALVLEASSARQRALLVRCDAVSCREPLRISLRESSDPTDPFQVASNRDLDPARLTRARAWLDEPSAASGQVADRKSALWRSWYLWGAAAAAAVAGTALVWSAAQPPDRRLRVVIDPRGAQP